MKQKPLVIKLILIFILQLSVLIYFSIQQNNKFIAQTNNNSNINPTFGIECYRCSPNITDLQDAYFSTYGILHNGLNNINRSSFIGYNLQNYSIKSEDIPSYYEFFKNIVAKNNTIQELNLNAINRTGLSITKIDSIGIVRTNTLILKLININRTEDYRTINLNFTSNINKYIYGDWNGDGINTIGVVNRNAQNLQFILILSYDDQNIRIVFNFGNPDWIPIAGDWNGDKIDTIGLYDPLTSTFYLQNFNSAGNSDISFTFMTPNQNFIPIAGDWDGDGKSSVGLFDKENKIFYLKNENSTGNPDFIFKFGDKSNNYKVVTGNWYGLGFDSVGLWNMSTGEIKLKYLNDSSNYYTSFFLGDPSSIDLNSIIINGNWSNLNSNNIGIGNLNTLKNTNPNQIQFLTLSSILPRPINNRIIVNINSPVVNFIGNVVCDVNALIFVNGDINFYSYNFVNRNIHTNCNFIAKGKITINSPISNFELASPTPKYNQISALLLSDEGIDVNLETPQNIDQYNFLDARGIIIRGSLISKKDIKFLGRLDNEPNQNSLRPAFVVEYDPRFREFLRNVIGYKKYRILE